MWISQMMPTLLRLQQRTMLGESLYPPVDQLEHEMAAKVIGVLLEMDQLMDQRRD